MDEADSVAGVVDDSAHRWDREPPAWRGEAEEDTSALGLRPPVAEVVDDRLTDVGRKRHRLVATGLAVHDELTGSPVEVVEHHRRDLSGAQPEAGEEKKDRVVPSPLVACPIATFEQASEHVGSDALRQRA
jgi:hypothetical protein